MTKAIVLSGGSASGKNFLTTFLEYRCVFEDKIGELSISLTTRPPREGEVDGKDYHFVSKEEFRTLIDESAFLEFEEVFGEYYGTLNSEVERIIQSNKVPIFIVDPLGNANLSNLLSKRGIDALSVCLEVDKSLALNRSINRVMSEEDLTEDKTRNHSKRIANSQFRESHWIKMVNYDLITKTGNCMDDVERCISEIQSSLLTLSPTPKQILVTDTKLNEDRESAKECAKKLELIISKKDKISPEKLNDLIIKTIIRVNNEQTNILREGAFCPN